MIKIQIILGSTRQGRKGEVVAHWVMELAKARTDAQFELIDLRDWELPFYNDPKPAFEGDYSFEYTKKWSAKISEGDGYILITPEYNHGYSAVLKNALDHLYDEWAKKPVGFLSYGGLAAGARAVEQLRLVTTELGLLQVRTAIHIPKIRAAFSEDGEPIDDTLPEKANQLFTDTIQLAEVLKPLRQK